MSVSALTFQNLNWWLVPIVIVIGFLLYISYHHFHRKKAGTALLLLRLCFFVGILFLWCKPQLNYQISRRHPPQALIWVDNSLSMAAQDNFDAGLIEQRLTDISDAVKRQGGRLIYKKFSRKVMPLTDFSKLSYDGYATNISQALRQGIASRKTKNIVAGLLISDGVFNQGQNPLYADLESDFPIYTVGIGDSLIRGDPAVDQLQIPATATVGDTVQFKAEVVPQSERETITIVLSIDEQVVYQKKIPAEQEYFKKTLTFQHVFKEEGSYNIELSIPDQNDQNPYNNRRMDIIKVRAAAQKILLLSSQISFELRFLKQIFQSRDPVKLVPVVSHQGRWLSDSVSQYFAKDWDLVILEGFPSAQTPLKTIEMIKKEFKGINNIPLLIFINNQTSVEKLAQLRGYTIVQKYKRAGADQSTTARITAQGARHPVIRDMQLELQERSWQALPPIGYPFARLELADGFESLVVAGDLRAAPLIATGEVEAQRIGLFCGNDFWRWRFMTQATFTTDPYTESILNMFSWLTASEHEQRVQILPDKPVYLKGETMQLSGHVFDVKGEIIPEIYVEAAARRNTEEPIRFTIPWTGDIYAAEIPLRKRGKYQVEITAYDGDVAIGQTEHSFTVMEQPLELVNIYQNSAVLQTIARKTGGAKIDLAALDRLVQDVSYKEQKRSEHHRLQIWRWPGSFVILLFFLLAEWIIRRTKGYQ